MDTELEKKKWDTDDILNNHEKHSEKLVSFLEILCARLWKDAVFFCFFFYFICPFSFNKHWDVNDNSQVLPLELIQSLKS